jgi:hypothetical protein
MKRILLVSIAGAMLASVLSAEPVCVQDTLENYITNNVVCTIGDKIFSNWGYSSATTTAAQVNVVPTPGPTPNLDPAVQFSSGAWNAFPGQTKDATIFFTVAAPAGIMLIEDAGVVVAGSVTGTGTGTVDEHMLNPNTNADIPGSPLHAAVTVGPTNPHVDFVSAGGVPMTSLNVQTFVHVSAGSGSHTTISAITEDFSQITAAPEPVETLLIGSGILALGLVWRKRTSHQS